MAAVAAVITTSFVRSPPPSPSSQPQLSPSTTVQNAATITATATTTINFGPATSDQKKNIVNDVLLSECIMNTDDNDNDHSNNLQSDSDSASEVDSSNSVPITPIDIFPSSVIFNNDNRNNNNNSPLPLLPITYTTSITTAIIDDDNSNTVPQRSLHDIIINGGTKRLFTTLESVIEAPAATTVPTTATSNSAPSPPSSSSTNISESTSTTASPPTTTATLSNINNNNCNNGNGSGYDLSNLLIQNAVQALSQISDPIIPVNITSNFTTNVMLMMMNGNCNNNNYTIDPKIITTTRPPPIVPNIITNFSKNAIDNNNIVINCNDLNNDRSFSIISPPLETPELVSSGCDSSGSSNNNDKRKRKLKSKKSRRTNGGDERKMLMTLRYGDKLLSSVSGKQLVVKVSNSNNKGNNKNVINGKQQKVTAADRKQKAIDDEDYVPPTEKKIKKKSGRKPRSSNKSKRNKKQPMVNSGLATSSYSYSSPSTTSTTGHVTNNHTEGAKRKRVECQAPVSNKRISVVVNESQHGFAAADLRQQPLAQAVASGDELIGVDIAEPLRESIGDLDLGARELYASYGFACRTPRLDLSSFASESIADRRQPVLQLYCWVCFENESYKGDHLISCGGCPKAYHQSCLEVPTTEQAVAGGAGAWYCGEGCKNNYNNKKIVVELPRKKMPLMLDPKNQGVEGPVTSASRSQASRRSSRT
ncbi:9318_t:CDS:10 [Entrophospora sp. SA101]|nr:9318_t:CDS:10 [Entrophospora sp. SA101]